MNGDWLHIINTYYISLRMVTTLYISLKTEPEQIYINNNKSSLKKKYCVASLIYWTKDVSSKYLHNR
jgi:hypothetical protein